MKGIQPLPCSTQIKVNQWGQLTDAQFSLISVGCH